MPKNGDEMGKVMIGIICLAAIGVALIEFFVE